jgi:hypothetical protein
LIKRSAETPRSPSIVARSLAGPTSKRPQINYVHYLRIPSRILKHTAHEDIANDVVAEVAVSRVVNH